MKLSYMKRGAAAAIIAGTLAFAPVAAVAQTVPASNVADNVVVHKTWTAASNTQLNNDETFTFEVKFNKSIAQGSYTPQDFTNWSNEVKLTSYWLDNAKGGTSASAQLTAKQLFGDKDFTTPGTYVFDLSEVKGDNPNIVYSNAKYTVVVTVAMPDNYPTDQTPKIKSVTVHRPDYQNSEDNKADGKFENGVAENASLEVSKTVAGTAANIGDEFSYTLTITGAQGSYDVSLPDGATAKVENGTPYEFKLKHGQHIEVKNLPKGAKYTVVETDTAYDEHVSVNGGDFTDGLKAEGVIADENTVAYKNEKGFAPDSGITMNTLPFVGIGVVAVAGAATLVISRRRRSGEEF